MHGGYGMGRQGLGFSDGVFLLFLLFFFFLALFRDEKGVYSCISNGPRHITT